MITRLVLKNRFHSGKFQLFICFLLLHLSLNMDYDNHLFNEISINSLLCIIYRLIFLFYSFLKPRSEALRLWLCMYVEDQGCQAMNNLNEMSRSKTSALTLYANWPQDPTNHIEVLDCWPWWFPRRNDSLLPTTLNNRYPLCSRHFLFVIRIWRELAR